LYQRHHHQLWLTGEQLKYLSLNNRFFASSGVAPQATTDGA
jgi:hypothetical protein